MTSPGYHITEIEKGELGELSKILEELHEAIDADMQNCKIMTLLELADMYGATQKYLEKHHPTVTMDDLKHMSTITARAFTNGHRG